MERWNDDRRNRSKKYIYRHAKKSSDDILCKHSDFPATSEIELFARILVGIDESSASVAALAEAIRLAEAEKGMVRAVSVVERMPVYIGLGPGFDKSAALARSLKDGAQKALERASDLFTLTGIVGETALINQGDEDVALALLRESREWNADVVVLGTPARHGIQRLIIGSAAEAFLRIATVPVLVIPHRGEEERH
jgi:nucleotide-binding universal stress UspA family protein